MRLTGSIRPTLTTELVAGGRDLPAARAALEAQVPAGHVLVRAHDQKLREGVEVHGLIRPDRVEQIDAEGADYATAAAALRAQVPAGYQLLQAVRS